MRSTTPGTRQLASWATVVAVALAGCTALPLGNSGSSAPTSSPSSAAPAQPITAVVMAPAKTPLRLRAKPSTSAKVLATIKRGTTVTLLCVTTGSRVRGPEGDSTLWHRVTHAKKTGYLSASYLKGGDNPLVPRCAEETGPTPVNRGPELDAKIVELARGQADVVAAKGNCTPYGECGAWSGLFATWVWRKAGIQIPKYPYGDDIYTWGQRGNRSHLGLDKIGVGDLVLTGTGPKDAKTSTRVDIVVEVFPDHLRVIGGDVKGKVAERDLPRDQFYGWVDA